MIGGMAMLDVESFLLGIAAGRGGGGGKSYATGTYTLASVTEAIEFNPGLSFTPRIFVIYAANPDYTINGCVGAVFTNGVPVTILGPNSDVNYIYSMLETRNTWGTNARIQANVTIGSENPVVSSGGVSLPCRHISYKWPVGEFVWEAWE